MAAEAERVVVAIEALTAEHDARMTKSAQVVDASMGQITRSAKRAENSVKVSSASIARSFDQASARSRLLGYQISDIGTQLAGGQSPFLILAQQAPQVSNALEGTAGVAGRVATFFSGPWGAALLAAASVVGVLISKHKEESATLEDLIAKLQEEAVKQDLSRRAHEAFTRTLQGQIQAQRDLNEEIDRGIKSQRTLDEQAIRTTQSNLRDNRKALADAQRALARAQESLRRAQVTDPNATNAADAAAQSQGQIDIAQRRVDQAQAQVNLLRSAITGAEQEIRGLKGRLATEAASIAVDPIKRINDQYDRMAEAARTAALGNDALTASLQKTLTTIERQRQAALKKEQDSRRTNATDGDLTSFIRPVGGRVSGSYGTQRPGHTHGGVDLAVPVGTNVAAAAAGTVIEVGTLPGYGNVVIIDHGRGTTTRYAHLSKLLVAKGQQVGQGDTIALSGGAKGAAGSGNSQGPHLHYEVRRNGRSVNPLSGQFPTDTLATGATAARSAAQALVELQREVDSLADRLDPATTAAADFRATIERIDKLHAAGLISDVDAITYSMSAATSEAKRLGDAADEAMNRFIDAQNFDPSKSLADSLGIDARRDAEFELKQEGEQKLQAQRADNIQTLANLYESAFSGGVTSVWDLFKREGIQAIALLLAKLTAQQFGSANSGGGLLSGLVTSVASLFGRASGGHISAGQLVRVNEGASRGRVEGFRPAGSGTIIPLGQMAAKTGGGTTIVQQHFTLDARYGITTPELIDYVNQKAGEARSQAVALSVEAGRKGVPSQMQRFSVLGTP